MITYINSYSIDTYVNCVHEFLCITIQLPHVYYNGITSYLLDNITNKYYEYAMILSV